MVELYLHFYLSALFRVDEDVAGLFELMLRRVSEEAVTSKYSCPHNRDRDRMH